MIPRKATGEVATVMNSGIVKLHDLHRDMQARLLEGTLPGNVRSQYDAEMAAGRREDALTKRRATGKVQLRVEVKVAMYSAGEPTRMLLSLWSPEAGQLSEPFLVKYTSAGMPENLALLGNVKVVFRDVFREDIAPPRQLFLLTRIYRYGALAPGDVGKKGVKGKDDGLYLRPYGIAMTSLTGLGLQYRSSGVVRTDRHAESRG
jgi:hypothetical protein